MIGSHCSRECLLLHWMWIMKCFYCTCGLCTFHCFQMLWVRQVLVLTLECGLFCLKGNKNTYLPLLNPLPGSLQANHEHGFDVPWHLLGLHSKKKSSLLSHPQRLISVFSSRMKDGWWVWRSLTGSSIRNLTNAEGFSQRISQSGCSESTSLPATFLLEESKFSGR